MRLRRNKEDDWDIGEEMKYLRSIRDRKRKIPKAPKPEPIGSTVDFRDLKDFVTYGHNRVLTAMKVKTESEWKYRKDLESVKKPTDWGTVMKVMLIAIVAVVMILAIVPNLLTQYDVSGEYAQCRGALARSEALLSVCQGTGGVANAPGQGTNLVG